jgi:hypothetical protein
MAWRVKSSQVDEETRLRIFREEELPDEIAEKLDPNDEPQTLNIEDYWAGRNPAMRLSARMAA